MHKYTEDIFLKRYR